MTGIDLAEENITAARQGFAAAGRTGEFLCGDFLAMAPPAEPYHIIVCHDVIEHIADKEAFLSKMQQMARPDGIIFVAFPAWQMPFGGHQQMCRNRLVSHWPFVHLLPPRCYGRLLRACGETEPTVREMLDIQTTRTTIERFERTARRAGLRISDRRLYFINPHYETKFGLKPRILWSPLGRIPYVRNFFTTSCFYLLTPASSPA